MKLGGRSLTLLSGLVALGILGAAAWSFLRRPGWKPASRAVAVPAELSRDFERLPDNPEGYPEFRHRETGIVMVLLPGGTVRIGPDPEYRRQFVETYAREGRILTAREKRHVVFPDDEAELSPEERRERGKRRRLAEGWLAGESREVTLTPFLIAKYEVTQAQWTAVMGSNPSRFKIGGEDRPVERVSWDDCRRFCETTGLQLPSEARWEYACRGGSDATFGGTGRIDDMGWYMRNSGDRTHPVGRKSPNGFGLHDMHGNVWEWCEDIADWKFHERPESKGVNPVCRSGSGHRAFRGGSFRDGEFHSRASSRARADPKSTTVAGEGSIGFRPVFVP